MKHSVTVSVTLEVLADDCSKAEEAAFEAIDAIPLVDGIKCVSYTVDDSTVCQHQKCEYCDAPKDQNKTCAYCR